MILAIILTLVLLYVSIGLILMLRNMRGYMVDATLTEWVGLVLGWPLVLPFYRLLSSMRAQTDRLIEWAEEEQD